LQWRLEQPSFSQAELLQLKVPSQVQLGLPQAALLQAQEALLQGPQSLAPVQALQEVLPQVVLLQALEALLLGQLSLAQRLALEEVLPKVVLSRSLEALLQGQQSLALLPALGQARPRVVQSLVSPRRSSMQQQLLRQSS